MYRFASDIMTERAQVKNEDPLSMMKALIVPSERDP
jgi:hypothetical protein